MIFTFYKARGLNVGASLVEEDKLALAKELEEKAKVGSVGWLGGVIRPMPPREIGGKGKPASCAECAAHVFVPHSNAALPRPW